VPDQVRDGVGYGDSGEQGCQLDEISPPVVRTAGTLRGSHICHVFTVTEGCCVITNAL
jgi:hypothetical protein